MPSNGGRKVQESDCVNRAAAEVELLSMKRGRPPRCTVYLAEQSTSTPNRHAAALHCSAMQGWKQLSRRGMERTTKLKRESTSSRTAFSLGFSTPQKWTAAAHVHAEWVAVLQQGKTRTFLFERGWNFLALTPVSDSFLGSRLRMRGRCSWMQ